MGIKMICDYNDEYILDLLFRQLQIFKISDNEQSIIKKQFAIVKNKLHYNFLNSENKYFKREGEAFFNPFHSGQWCIFLYYLSNTLFKEDVQNRNICDKIYYLNKMLNSTDLFYEVNLPEIFFLDHPLGSVIGRGVFGNYFSFIHGCTVGNNNNVFPKFGENVKMLANSTVIGNSNIGNNVIIAANAYIKNEDIPDNSIVFGSSPHLIIKNKKY